MRLIAACLLPLLVPAMITFVLWALPGDPATNLCPEGVCSETARDNLVVEWHMDSAASFYWNWLGNAVQGNFGRSISFLTGEQVSVLLWDSLPATSLVVLIALLPILLSTALTAAGWVPQRFDPLWQAIGTPPAVILALFAAAVVIISFGASGGEEFLLHDEATNEVEHSQVFEDKTSTGVISEGTYSLTYGDNTSTITVDSSNSSLEKFAKELDTISGVRSMVMGAGSSADPYRLVLEGQDAGSEHSLWLSVESSNDTGVTPTFTERSRASDVGDMVLDEAGNPIPDNSWKLQDYLRLILGGLILGIADGVLAAAIVGTRSTFQSEVKQRYIGIALLRGESVLSNALPNVLPALVGQFRSRVLHVLSGAVVVEVVLQIDGLGDLLWGGTLRQDFFIVLAAAWGFSILSAVMLLVQALCEIGVAMYVRRGPKVAA